MVCHWRGVRVKDWVSRRFEKRVYPSYSGDTQDPNYPLQPKVRRQPLNERSVAPSRVPSRKQYRCSPRLSSFHHPHVALCSAGEKCLLWHQDRRYRTSVSSCIQMIESRSQSAHLGHVSSSNCRRPCYRSRPTRQANRLHRHRCFCPCRYQSRPCW